MNGTWTDLPETPKVGRSRLRTSTSGRRVRLPTGMAKIGMSFARSRAAASTGGLPSFQSPSDAMTTPCRFGIASAAFASGPCRSLPRPPSAGENGWITTFQRSRSEAHAAGSDGYSAPTKL